MKKAIKKIFDKLKNDDGWTFIETLIVVTIILILTATVGFSALGNLKKAKKASAQSQIDSFCVALEAYYLDCGNYPTSEQGLMALKNKPSTEPVSEFWNGPYLYKNPPKDPWGNDYEYIMPGIDGNAYGIRSFGADGIEGGEGESEDVTSWL